MIRNQPDPVLEAMSRSQLKDAIQAHRQFLAKTQKVIQEARDALLRLGMEACGERIDQLQKDGTDLESLELVTLIRLIQENLTWRSLPTGSAGEEFVNAHQRLAEAQREAETSRRQVDEANQRAREQEMQVRTLEATLKKLQDDRVRLEAQLAAPPTRAVPTSHSDSVPSIAEWFEQWVVGRNRERLERIVLILGETGLSRYSELEARAAEYYKIGESTCYAMVVDCEREGLVDRSEEMPPTRGRPAKIVTLTNRGRWLYRKLTGKEPVEPEHERLIRAHKSEAHLALILRVADCFTALGYEVVRNPLKIEIAGNRYFEPDLVIRKDGETMYLEVERGDKDRPALEHKWENARMAGAGRIYLAADKPGTLNRLQSNIIQWATLEGKRITLFKTHLEALKTKVPGESPWSGVKEIGGR